MADKIETELVLKDGVSGPATDAQKALAGLDAQAKKTRDAFGRFVKSGSSPASGAMAALESQSASAKSAVAELGSIGSKSGSLLSSGFMAAGKELALYGAGLLAAGAAATFFALKQADAHRSTLLSFEALTGSREAAEALDDSISRLADSVPVGKDRLEEMAKGLALAKLSGTQLTDALKTVAIASSAAGPEAAAAIEGIIKTSKAGGAFKVSIKQLRETGVDMKTLLGEIAKNTGIGADQVEKALDAGKISADVGIAALNKAVQGRFGDVADKQFISFSSQLTRIQDFLGDLFDKVDIEPFLKAINEITSLFSENTELGGQIQDGIGQAFSFVFGILADLMPLAKEFILGLVDGLKIAWKETKPLRDAFMSALEPILGPSGDGAKAFFRVLGQVVGFAIPIVVTLANSFLPLIGYAIKFGQAVSALWGIVTSAFSGISSAVSNVANAITSTLGGIDLLQIGSDMIQGFIDGIAGAAGRVAEAVSSIANSATATLKGALGIASPSKVFAGLGGYTAEGFAQGVDAGSADVSRSVETMVTTPDVAAAGAAGASSSSSSSSSVDVGGITIQITGVKDAESLRDIMPQALAQAFEQIGLGMGAAA